MINPTRKPCCRAQRQGICRSHFLQRTSDNQPFLLSHASRRTPHTEDIFVTVARFNANCACGGISKTRVLDNQQCMITFVRNTRSPLSPIDVTYINGVTQQFKQHPRSHHKSTRVTHVRILNRKNQHIVFSTSFCEGFRHTVRRLTSHKNIFLILGKNDLTIKHLSAHNSHDKGIKNISPVPRPYTLATTPSSECALSLPFCISFSSTLNNFVFYTTSFTRFLPGGCYKEVSDTWSLFPDLFDTAQLIEKLSGSFKIIPTATNKHKGWRNLKFLVRILRKKRSKVITHLRISTIHVLRVHSYTQIRNLFIHGMQKKSVVLCINKNRHMAQ